MKHGLDFVLDQDPFHQAVIFNRALNDRYLAAQISGERFAAQAEDARWLQQA